MQESNGRYAVAIAPGVVLRWWFELHDRHVRCFVKVDATALKDYTLVDIDAAPTSFHFRCNDEHRGPHRHAVCSRSRGLGEIHLATRRVFTFILIIYNVVAFEH